MNMYIMPIIGRSTARGVDPIDSQQTEALARDCAVPDHAEDTVTRPSSLLTCMDET